MPAAGPFLLHYSLLLFTSNFSLALCAKLKFENRLHSPVPSDIIEKKPRGKPEASGDEGGCDMKLYHTGFLALPAPDSRIYTKNTT